MEVALVGNPNTGKTSLFNYLTGSYEYVGNWSGVTVEKKIGALKSNAGLIIDLPGIYTLSPLSKDEGVVSQFFLNEPFDKVLNIVDASQVERNLHLTIQLLEFGKPIIVGLNMVDVAQKRGIYIDPKELSKQLGVPVIPIVARNGNGCEQIISSISQQNDSTTSNSSLIYYGKTIEKAVTRIEEELKSRTTLPIRWLAIQLMSGNSYVYDFICSLISKQKVEQWLSELQSSLLKENVTSLEQLIFYKRKEFIDRVIVNSIQKKNTQQLTTSEKIDLVVTNKFLGIPLFLILMYVLFMITFDWLGFPLSDILDGIISGPVTITITSILGTVGASPFLESLILDGVVAGVGGVLVFVPQIFILFFFISWLEDSGYMARVALVMDRLMESVGLNGKAFIPLIIGFGCNVPGIMAARTIETPKERLLTILLTPLMSCSARLPVYALFVGMFFVQNKALVVLSLYVLGIIVALILARIFSNTILKGETSLFVIELPPYRMPQAKALWRSTWDKGKGFIKKAGTFIFAGSVFIWLFSYLGPNGIDVPMDESYLALIGSFIAPLFTPIGFGTWQAAAALITGFLAKEAIISTMNIIYIVPHGASIHGILSAHFTPLAAYSFMVFILLYIPCLATTATIYKEVGSKKWTLFSIVYAFSIAYFLSLIIYQIGSLLGL